MHERAGSLNMTLAIIYDFLKDVGELKSIPCAEILFVMLLSLVTRKRNFGT